MSLPSKFIDISRYQGEWVDPEAAKRLGIEGVCIRATVGDYYTDPKFKEFYQIAVDHGYRVTAYHVMTPNDGAGRRTSASAQMNRFFDVVGARKLTDPVVLDNELARGEDKNYITSIVQNCFKALHGFQGFDYPFNYTNAGFWNAYVIWASSFLNYPLWVANYTTRATPVLPKGYNNWALWQWSADGNGLGQMYGFTSYSIDLNRVAPQWLNREIVMPADPEPLTLEERVANLENRVAALEAR